MAGKRATLTVSVDRDLHDFYKDTLQWDKRLRVADMLREAVFEYAIKNGFKPAEKASD